MTLRQVEVPYRLGLDYGIGIDAASGSPMNTVAIGPISGVEFAIGPTSQFSILQINTTADLEESLGIDAEASYGVGLFSASARFNFARKVKVQSQSLFMAITARVTLGFKQIDRPELDPAAAELADNPERFSQRFGNMFVRGISSGGIFVGILKMQTASREESEKIAADLKGSYGLFSADAKLKFESIQKAHNLQLNIMVYREGGPAGDSLDDPSNPMSLYTLFQRWLKSFETSPDTAAVPYAATFAPTAIANGPLPPNNADIEHAQDVLMFCGRARSATLDRLNLLDFILSNPAQYDFSDSPQSGVVEALNGCQADLDLIARTASHAINHPKTAKMPTEFATENSLTYPRGLLPSPMPTKKSEPAAPQGVWSVKASMTDGNGGTRLLAGVDGKLFAVHSGTDRWAAGETGVPDGDQYRNGSIERYDPASNSWTVVGPMPVRLLLAAALGANGEIFVAGNEKRATYKGILNAYDPRTNGWRACAPMPTRRYGGHLVSGMNGKIYAIGGRTGEPGSLTQVVEEYDPPSDSWTNRAPMPTVRDSIGVATAQNGKIYVIGGLGHRGGHWGLNNFGSLSVVEEFDPATDQWTSRKSIRVARTGVGVGVGLNGRIYAIGGSTYENHSSTQVSTVEEYDPSTDTWTDKASLNKARGGPGVATSRDGTIYVAGGGLRFGSQISWVADVEAFRP